MPSPYFVGAPTPKQGAHHESIRALWELKWKKRVSWFCCRCCCCCWLLLFWAGRKAEGRGREKEETADKSILQASLGIYPFMEGKLEDLEEVFDHFKTSNLHPPYDFESYSAPFFPIAERLERLAQDAERSNDLASAGHLYLRAACVYRTARQPCPIAPSQQLAWERNKAVFYKGAAYLDPPLSEHLIPFADKPGAVIPVTVRIPHDATRTKFPTVLQIYGLDGYRTEHVNSSNHHIAHGWASIGVEIPGTGDCPADRNDPTSPDKLWTSVLDWIEQQEWVEQGKVVAWGVSAGGYYAMRIAHTHRERLAGVVAQGGGCHHMFDPEWLEIASHMEYPFE